MSNDYNRKTNLICNLNFLTETSEVLVLIVRVGYRIPSPTFVFCTSQMQESDSQGDTDGYQTTRSAEIEQKLLIMGLWVIKLMVSVKLHRFR